MSNEINYRGNKNRPLTHNELDNNFRYANEWEASTEYKQGMLVLHDIAGNGEPYFYQSKNDHTSGTTFDATLWNKVGVGGSGVPGVQGATGATSTIPGPTGVTGATGATGADSTVQGPTGATGATGDKGDQGNQGNPGAPSTVQGPIGVTGATGLQGATGATGLQGATGATSTVQGPPGNTGNIGNPGPDGKGLRGFSTTAFALGNAGNSNIIVRPNLNTDNNTLAFMPNGYIHIAKTSATSQYQVSKIINYNEATGAMTIAPPNYISPIANTNAANQWIINASAIQGPTGATGIGVTGATGIGVTGATGIVGATGPGVGATGATGQKGDTGADGLPGVGATGLTGVTGPTGTDGTNGTNGINGIDGIDGIDGTNGTNGATGATGPTGPVSSLSINYFDDTNLNGFVGVFDIGATYPTSSTIITETAITTAATSPVLIKNFAYVKTFGDLNLTTLQSGIFKTLLYGTTTNSAVSNNFEIRIGILNVGGGKTTIATANSSFITSQGVAEQTTTELIHPVDVAVLSTDRLFVDIYAVTTDTSNVTLTFSYDSTSTPSRIGTPIPISEKGATGIQGATGATGIQGATGATGISVTGPTGATGTSIIGATGLQGVTGATGIQGATGSTDANQSWQEVSNVSALGATSISQVVLNKSYTGATGPRTMQILGGATGIEGYLKSGYEAGGTNGSGPYFINKGASYVSTYGQYYQFVYNRSIIENSDTNNIAHWYNSTNGGEWTNTTITGGAYRKIEIGYSGKLGLEDYEAASKYRELKINPNTINIDNVWDTNEYSKLLFNTTNFKLESLADQQNGTEIYSSGPALYLNSKYHGTVGQSAIATSKITLSPSSILLEKQFVNPLYNTQLASSLKLGLGNVTLKGTYEGNSAIYSVLNIVGGIGATGPSALFTGATGNVQVKTDGNFWAETVPVGSAGDTRILVVDSTTGEFKYRTDISGTPALTSGQIFVGNASNAATSVAMSGDIAITSVGVTTIQPDSVTYDKMQDVTQAAMLGNQTGAGAITEIPIIEQYITNTTAIGLLNAIANWDVNGIYGGTAITGTFQGQAHYNGNYWFTAVDDNDWIRLIRG